MRFCSAVEIQNLQQQIESLKAAQDKRPNDIQKLQEEKKLLRVKLFLNKIEETDKIVQDIKRQINTYKQPIAAEMLEGLEAEKRRQKMKELRETKRKIEEMLQKMNLTVKFEECIESQQRIGKISHDDYQLVHIKLKTLQWKRELLQKAKTLKDDPAWANVFVNNDLTKEQKELDYRLRQDLKRRRSSDPEQVHYIKNGKVVSFKTDKK